MTGKEVIFKLMENQFNFDHPQKPKGYGVMGIHHKHDNIIRFNKNHEEAEPLTEVEFRLVTADWFNTNYVESGIEIILEDITENYYPIIKVEN